VPAGVGRVAVVEGGGHYPHAQYGDRVAELISAFLQNHAAADPVRDVG